MAESSSPHSAIQLVHQHQRAGRTAEAQRVCREALRRQPDDADLLHLFGMLCCEADRDAEAVDLIRRAVNLEPGNAQFHQNLGTVLGRLGQHKEAANAFGKAVAIRPDYGG